MHVTQISHYMTLYIAFGTISGRFWNVLPVDTVVHLYIVKTNEAEELRLAVLQVSFPWQENCIHSIQGFEDHFGLFQHTVSCGPNMIRTTSFLYLLYKTHPGLLFFGAGGYSEYKPGGHLELQQGHGAPLKQTWGTKGQLE